MIKQRTWSKFKTLIRNSTALVRMVPCPPNPISQALDKSNSKNQEYLRVIWVS